MKDFLAEQIIKRPELTDLTPLPWPLGRKTKDFLTGINLWALERSQYWPKEKMAGLQFERVKEMLYHAYDNVKLWRELLTKSGLRPEKINNFNDFKKIPITDRQAISQRQTGELIPKKSGPQDMRFFNNTSGSTGHPLRIFYDPYLIQIREMATNARELANLGVDFKKHDYISFNMFVHWILDHGNLLIFNKGLDDLRRNKKKIYECIGADKSPILFGVTSVLVELARLAKYDNFRPDVAGILCRTEKLWPEDRRLLEETFNCPVSNSYGMRETKHLAHECRYHNGFHINSESFYVEIVDEKGNNVSENTEGRIIVTAFENKMMPIIRYDSGDIGKVISERCLCGSSLPRIFVEGRSHHFFELPDGDRVPLKILLRRLQLMPLYLKIQQFQFIQNSKNKIDLLIQPREKFEKTDEMAVRMILDEIFGGKIETQIRYVDKIDSSGSKATSFIKTI